jgi:hypothetical protein
MENVIINTLKYMAGFPFAAICRHLVAINMLSDLEKEYPELANNPKFVALVRAFSDNSAGDEIAEELLKDPELFGSCLKS